MVDLMLIIKNFSTIQYLINYIINSNENIRIHHISFDINESLNYYLENHFDINIILTDFDIDKINNFKDCIHNTLNIDISKSIIVYSSNTILSSTNSIYISDSYDNILKKVNKLSLDTSINNLERTKQIINNYLLKLGYKHSHTGTKYLYEIIYYLIINQYKSCPNLTKIIYPYIARKFSTTTHNVKCVIALATRYMNSKTTITKLEKNTLFNVDDYINTVSVINYILKKTVATPK